MSYISSAGSTKLLIDTPDSVGAQVPRMDPRAELVSWIMTRVEAWERIRDQDNDNLKRWGEYWRVWRGVWSLEEQKRKSERSRIITPATAQAIEMTVAEIEEALFSRERWIDVVDDILDEEKASMEHMRDLLLEDLEIAGVKDALAESVMNAAMFGTGIIKVCTDVIDIPKVGKDKYGKAEEQLEERALVRWEAIRPDEFIPDPSGVTVPDMLGCAHRPRRPLHAVLEKIEAGVYLRSALHQLAPADAPRNMRIDQNERAWRGAEHEVEEVDVVEYHGKVPAKFLVLNQEARTEADQALVDDLRSRPDDGDGPLAEAIVTIANGHILLRAMPNPFTMHDRSIVAWAHEKVPGQFWGRGVAEKAINSQRALDTEVRARIDALGYVAAPMVGVDITKMAKGFKREVYPGKVWAFNGNPNEALMPVKMGNLDGNTFNQAAEMERMVQMATGAFDAGTALGRGTTSSGGNAATAGSMQMGAFVKRARRAIQNLDRNAITPLIEKTLWRYMQFAPRRYPVMDYKFVVKATLGMVAREIEQVNLTQVMGMLPEAAPQVTVAVAKGIIDLANVHNKGEILAAMEAAMQPPSPEQQQRQQQAEALAVEIQLEEVRQMKAETTKILAEVRELLTRAEVNSRRADVESTKVQIEDNKVALQAQENQVFAQQVAISEKNTDLKERALEHKIKQDAKKSNA